MKAGSALKDHLDALNSILMDLKNVEVKIDDKYAALILLLSLPLSFENFMNSFVVRKDTITLEDVRSILHSQELRHQASRTSESQPVGLSATGQDREEGHWKFSCPKLKEKGQVTTVAKDDSGLERDVFDSGHVFMGNDSPCKVFGIGTIRIKMHDGVVRTLIDVRLVPDLKKNLISLGVLDSKDFKYTSENGVLRVSKGALVVMKATKGTSSLYTLQGETIIGSASVSCSEKSNSNLTMLWHMRLGYMSEKGMVLLSKWGLLDNHKVGNLEFCKHCVIGNKSKYPATPIDCKTKIEVWPGKLVDYSKLCVFRCPIYYHVSEGKLDPSGKKGIFIGYGDGVKGYRIWSPSEIRVILSRDVEDVPKQVERVVPGDMDHDVTLPDDQPYSPHLEHEQDMSIAYDRPCRNEKVPSRFGFEDYVAYALQVAEEVESFEPATYREAVTSKDSDMWIAAMSEEIESLQKNNT
ncbi:retrovirus-related pol polyprotein from transposon TNT 1-94 [Tanacetum coccineum]|uniref:Retrovirus-related pol polyprotein from transposon TNT 1-94 n=1 Tax=Tanacetum coccineum TaxID=301880 RepID=A0ABQ5DX25_9ASTR